MRRNGTYSFDFLKIIFNKIVAKIALGRSYLFTDLLSCLLFLSAFFYCFYFLRRAVKSRTESCRSRVSLFIFDPSRPTRSNIATRLADLAFHLASRSHYIPPRCSGPLEREVAKINGPAEINNHASSYILSRGNVISSQCFLADIRETVSNNSLFTARPLLGGSSTRVRHKPLYRVR